MNIYIFKPIVVNLRDKYFDFKVFLKYRFRFLIGKFKTKFKYNLKAKHHTENSYIHICNFHNKDIRNWETHKINKSLSLEFTKKYNNKENYISFLRLIVPAGILKLKEVGINYKKIVEKSNKSEEKRYKIKKKDLRGFQNLKYIDFPLNQNIEEINITSKDIRFIPQEIFIKPKKSNSFNTIYIILDAADFENLTKTEAYKKHIQNKRHIISKTFASSSLTISSLPSLLLLQPVAQHLIGKLGAFYEPSIDLIPDKAKSIPEIISPYIDYSVGFTTFAKTTHSRAFHKGFTSYFYRCYEKNYSPSSLDSFLMYLRENDDLFNSIDNFFAFIHDSGAHPGYHPIFSLDEKIIQSDFSYKDTYNLSLDKVGALINTLESNKILEDTNIIITGDHTKTDNQTFNVFENNLFPSRLTVPVLFLPAKKIGEKNFKNLEQESLKIQPSINLISKIFEAIYSIKINTTNFVFGEFDWLSAQYSYPNMDKLIILGLYKRKNIFLTAKVSHEFLFNNCNIEARKHIDIFYLKQRKLKRIPENDEIYSEVIKSLLDYLRKCSESRNLPLLQKDLDLY
tara:strand:- start:2588 stop:4288 length:1701 start_codon:yes stop_codon:yes gene_type:complete